MELKYKGRFKRDIENSNRNTIIAIHEVVFNIKNASSISQIKELKKLRKFRTHFRIKVAGDYRIGVVVRGNKVWLICFGHRSNFYKSFP